MHAFERLVSMDRWANCRAPATCVLALLALEIVLFLVGRYDRSASARRCAGGSIPAPRATRRVRRRAILLFRLAAENRTRARTGRAALPLSLAERRAEIVADASIAAKVAPETWGEAMAVLIEAVLKGRAGDGMVAAVERIGQVLAEHFPRSADETNELPDRLILL